MKPISKLFFMAITASLFLTSCSEDEAPVVTPLGDYEKGTFVLNEGNSNPTTASVTFLGDNGAVEEDVFGTVNPTAEGLGSYLQSMFFAGDKAFIVSGSANKITVVNRYTFKYITTVSTDINHPRYGAVVNGKAYITNYADYSTGADDFLTVVDLTSFATTKIQLNNWSEKILESNGKLYIANGYYGSGNSITVYNPTTSATEAVIDLGAGNSPDSFEVKDGILYVLTANYGTPGKIIKISLSANQIASTVDIPASISGPKQLNLDEDKLYFTAGTSVYAMGRVATVVPTTPVVTYSSTSVWGQMYGFEVRNGKVYIADGGDFASDSKVYQYATSGTLLNTYIVGVGPNGFYFNN